MNLMKRLPNNSEEHLNNKNILKLKLKYIINIYINEVSSLKNIKIVLFTWKPFPQGSCVG